MDFVAESMSQFHHLEPSPLEKTSGLGSIFFIAQGQIRECEQLQNVIL